MSNCRPCTPTYRLSVFAHMVALLQEGNSPKIDAL
jgi:hypothetical protein